MFYFMYQNNYNGLYNPQNMFQQSTKTTNLPIGLKGRPVSSLEEARAAAVDFDGSIFFFPDLASNRIYTKQINVDGTASLKMYEYKEIPTVDTNLGQFVTRQEFDQTLTEIKDSLAKITPAAGPNATAQAKPAEKDTASMIAKQF